MAERSSMESFKNSFSFDAFTISKMSSVGYLACVNFSSKSYTIYSTSTVLRYLIESLPRKSKVTLLSPSKRTCSHLREQQPTVSASSFPFSLPTLKASLSIRYVHTPI